MNDAFLALPEAIRYSERSTKSQQMQPENQTGTQRSPTKAIDSKIDSTNRCAYVKGVPFDISGAQWQGKAPQARHLRSHIDEFAMAATQSWMLNGELSWFSHLKHQRLQPIAVLFPLVG